MSNVEQCKIANGAETFTRGTYNGIEVFVRDVDGYVNATEMCRQFNKRFRKIYENHAWQAYYEEFKNEYSVIPGDEFMYQLNKGIPDKLKFLRGTYVDPRLINYIAIWASPKYAIKVGKVMDSINDKVHDILDENELPDTPENAKPIFNEIVRDITKDINNEKIKSSSCWGVRDSPYKLDQWEQDDVRNLKRKIREATEALNKLNDELKTWGRLADQVE